MTKRDYEFASEEFHKFSNTLYKIKEKAFWYEEETYDDDTLREMLRVFKERTTELYNLSNKIESYARIILTRTSQKENK